MDMAKKRGRFTGGKIGESNDMSKQELEKLSKGTVSNTEPKKAKTKPEPAVPYSIRIPKKIYDKLEQAEEETGMRKSNIVVNGIVLELKRLQGK